MEISIEEKIVEKSRILENRARETIGPDVQEKTEIVASGWLTPGI